MKQKTNKAASKRFHFSAAGKAQRRKVRQSHFNARATGNDTRQKHPDQPVAHVDKGRITDLLPYS